MSKHVFQFSLYLATSPNKKWSAFIHLFTYFADAMSELEKEKGRAMQGWLRALSSREDVLITCFWLKATSCGYVVYGMLGESESLKVKAGSKEIWDLEERVFIPLGRCRDPDENTGCKMELTPSTTP